MTPLAVVQAHLHAYNARDLDALLATFAEDAVFAAGDQLVVGQRGLRLLFADAFAVPADAQMRLHRAVVEGDTVACELAERITVSGADHELDVAAFYTVREDLLTRVRVYRDPSGGLPPG